MTKIGSVQLKPELYDDLRYSVLLNEEKGSPIWVTSLPIQEHGYSLHKGLSEPSLEVWLAAY